MYVRVVTSPYSRRTAPTTGIHSDMTGFVGNLGLLVATDAFELISDSERSPISVFEQSYPRCDLLGKVRHNCVTFLIFTKLLEKCVMQNQTSSRKRHFCKPKYMFSLGSQFQACFRSRSFFISRRSAILSATRSRPSLSIKRL